MKNVKYVLRRISDGLYFPETGSHTSSVDDAMKLDNPKKFNNLISASLNSELSLSTNLSGGVRNGRRIFVSKIDPTVTHRYFSGHEIVELEVRYHEVRTTPLVLQRPKSCIGRKIVYEIDPSLNPAQ